MDKPKFISNSITIDLEDYQCEVTPAWKQPKKIHESVLTGKKSITYPNGLVPGRGRFSAEIIIWDTDGYVSNIEQDDVIDYYHYGDEGIHFNCIVKEYLPFKAEKEYMQINCCIILIESEEYVENPLMPATPEADPEGYTFHTAPIEVELSCDTTGATIYYTTDGSEPTQSSTEYKTPISISVTTTLKARAYMGDMLSRFSFIMTEEYIYDPA